MGRLFDYLVEHPEVMRLATWAGLERPTAVAAFEADSYRTKLIAIADAQRDGWLDTSFTPADLLALALGVTGAWFTASEALRTHDSPNPWSPQRLAQFEQPPSRPPPASSAARLHRVTTRTDRCAPAVTGFNPEGRDAGVTWLLGPGGCHRSR